MTYFLEGKTERVDRIVQTCLDIALKHNVIPLFPYPSIEILRKIPPVVQEAFHHTSLINQVMHEEGNYYKDSSSGLSLRVDRRIGEA